MSKPSYEDRIVALLDILGSKGMVRNDMDAMPEEIYVGIKRMIEEIKSQDAASSDPGYRLSENLISYAFTLKDGRTDFGTITDSRNPYDIKISQFSDLICFSCRNDSDAFDHLSNRIAILTWFMLAENIFIRGAIVSGKLYHDKEMIVGPALVDAYESESQVAVYPRVIVDEKVLDALGRPERISRDRDGVWFIDSLRSRRINGRLLDLNHDWAKIGPALEKRRKAHAKQPKILMKDDWMLSYFNDVVRETPPE